MTSLEQTDSDTESINTKGSQQKNVGDSDMDSLIESEDDDNDILAKSRLRLFPSDEEGTSDEDSSGIESRALSDSNFDSDNDDDSNAEEGITDDDLDDVRDEGCHKGPSVAEIRKRKIEDPRRLHPEIWFNEIGEVGTVVCLYFSCFELITDSLGSVLQQNSDIERLLAKHKGKMNHSLTLMII